MFLAGNHVHVGEEPFGLCAKSGLNLSARALGNACCICHQLGEIIEKPVWALGHRTLLEREHIYA